MVLAVGGNVSESIGQRFLLLVQKQPTRNWCTYYTSSEVAHTVSYEGLKDRSFQFATAYGSSQPLRKRIAICLYPALDLHAAFLGAILAGHIPAMMPPFSPKTEPEKLQKTILHFLESLNPDAVVIDDATIQRLQELDIKLPSSIQLISPLEALETDQKYESQRGDSEIAFIQHSSGTTGLQKGVALSHSSVMRHYEAYCEAIALNPQTDAAVSWLPLYHDMGLIACFIVPLLAGISIIEIPTLTWAAKPSLLLDAITTYQPTLCWLPNFSYAYLAQSLQRAVSSSNWNLSSIRLWTNCSEPVTYQSQKLFLDTFEKVGCNCTSLGASYAMAENVFAVTQNSQSMVGQIEVSKNALSHRAVSSPLGEDDTRILISCGLPLKGVSLKILEPETEAESKFVVGEIAIKSDFMFTQYWQNSEATAKAFTSDGYYRTGDIGFLQGEMVFVTGRLKDIIIIQGKNLHAGDIENFLSDIQGISPGRVVALGMSDEASGSERLMILAETDVTDETIKKNMTNQIRMKIISELNVTVSIIRLLPPRWLIKSTSGKMARRENKEKIMKIIEAGNV